MMSWGEEIAPHLAPADRERLDCGLGRAGGLVACETARSRTVVIHKDFYYANVLWDGTSVWGLDLDELSLGDAAFDVGHFLAHLERHAWRTGAGVDAAREPAAAFLAGYRREGGEVSSASVAFYKAYTFVKLAATEVERKGSGWRGAACALAGLGAGELERAPAS
jgi:aminoglycoside phosphotransferase (APT) family kinase protein